MVVSRRYAIISDIHANIEALEAVIADATAQNVSDFICLGDVVGYNAAPSECIHRIRKLGCKVVKGNHDHYCSDLSVDLNDFQPNAASVIEWTRRNISEGDTAWLRDLPLFTKMMGFTIVHSTLDTPGSFRYAFDSNDVKDHFAAQETWVCFHGHTHVPCIWRKCADGEIEALVCASGKVDPGKYFIKRSSSGQALESPRDDICRERADGTRERLIPADGNLPSGNYFINVGSVGQPRDGIPKASYVILSMASMQDLTFEFRRVDYDIESAVRRIEAAGLPERLITRLYTGL